MLAIVVIDQITKRLASAYLQGNEPLHVLPFLTFQYHSNTGAAFSLLQDFTLFLVFVGVAFVLYFSWELWQLRKVEKVPPFYVTALTLILAGAMGNLLDRSIAGYVVDFIYVHSWIYFPYIFNVADMAVCVGAACWLIEAFLARRRLKKQSEVLVE